MTLSIDGVRLHASRRSRGTAILILAAEAVLSLFLYVSFAAHLVWPDLSRAAAGISPYLSYEGRLSDTSGNPLGGTGEPYCFRFSIYDSASGGTKLWPAGTPGTTVATTTDGVFSALVGQADSLTYDFYDSDTVYLNVDVNTATSTNGSTCSGSWESLTPRQTIAASGYARAAQNVYSSLLKTNTASNRVDVGAGTGSGSPTLLSLDVNNTNQYVGQTCSTSGTIWYNSAQSMALVCENGTIKNIGNSTTTIAALTDGTNTISNGTVSFGDANGVSFGINGNTVTASVNAGGAFSQRWEQVPMFRFSLSNLTNITAISNVPFFEPFKFDGDMTLSRINWEMSRSTSGSNLFSVTAGIYSYANNTLLTLIASATTAFSNSATGSVSGIRRFGMGGFDVSTFTAGGYVLGMMFNAGANTASMNYSIRGFSGAVQAGAILGGTDSYNTATSYNVFPFFGRLSATTAAFPSAVSDAQVRGQFSGASAPINAWIGFNND